MNEFLPLKGKKISLKIVFSIYGVSGVSLWFLYQMLLIRCLKKRPREDMFYVSNCMFLFQVRQCFKLRGPGLPFLAKVPSDRKAY